jgi:hypothetical protein
LKSKIDEPKMPRWVDDPIGTEFVVCKGCGRDLNYDEYAIEVGHEETSELGVVIPMMISAPGLACRRPDERGRTLTTG